LVLELLSIQPVWLIFPRILSNEFKTEGGTVHLYFEATTVILTLVLLGQLLEAKAHSRTSGAIIIKLAHHGYLSH
jgi:Cu2+-exporting ATPase